MRLRARGASLAAASLIAVGLTACGDGEKPAEPKPTAWAAAEATNTNDKDGEKADDDQYKVVKGDPLSDVKLPDGGESAMVDPATWPEINNLLSPEQLKGFIPTQNFSRTQLCATGMYEGGGGSTPKNVQCSWEMEDNGRFKVTLRGIGADSQVVAAWDKKRSELRGEAGDGDSFYKDGTYGSRRALLLRNGFGSVVVSNGEVAAWFDIQYPDEDFLVEGNAPATFDAVRTKSFPTFVETMVAYLPREK
ncbi:hypothetical protein [Demetria terragena]|uniref:hypothetical protein n=1 Tax=Demetria terragena TaxID=63959 RepID=UPI000370EB25|nr:hypothetical protein [Demetria terragena]